MYFEICQIFSAPRKSGVDDKARIRISPHIESGGHIFGTFIVKTLCQLKVLALPVCVCG